MTLTDGLLAEWRKVTDAATPGSWTQEHDGSYIVHGPTGTVLEAVYSREDAEFAATARTAMPQLLDEVDQLRYERGILGYSRIILDRMAEYENLTPFDQSILRGEAAKAAQSIVDEIGHSVTDEPALGPDLRARIAELEAELATARAEIAELTTAALSSSDTPKGGDRA